MEITDRSGRIWQVENYDSPSGPAFYVTIPDGPSEAAGWASGYTAHFDGSILYEPRQDSSPAADDTSAASSRGYAAYAAYGEAVDHRNFRGEPMPSWHELPEKIRLAWDAAAKAAHA